MRCVFPTCDNSASNKLPQEISFFIFPVEQHLRTAWLKALNKEGWEPEKDSAVCSKHFLIDDMMSTNMQTELRVGAVPVDYLQVCRICFSTNCKLYQMTQYKILIKAYETLTGLLMDDKDKLPPYLCKQCSHQILKCARFKTRSVQAYSMLLDIIKRRDYVSLESIQSVNGMQSPLHHQQNQSDRYDLDFNLLEEENINTSSQMTTGHLPVENINYDYLKVEIEDQTKSDIHINEGMTYKYIKAEKDSEANQDIRNDADSAMNANLLWSGVPKDESKGVDMETDNMFKQDVKNKSLSDNMEYGNMSSSFINPDTTNNYNMLCTSGFSGNMEKNVMLNQGFTSQTIKVEIEIEDMSLGEKYSSYDNSHLNVGQEAKEVTAMFGETKDSKDFIVQDINTPGGTASDTGTLMIDTLCCKLCPFRAINQARLTSHLKAHAATKSFDCYQCDYKTRFLSKLKTHLRIHTGEKPFKCQICNKGFSQKNARDKHFVLHTGARPFSCDVCKKTFSGLDNLTSHIKLHSDQKPYSCDVCQKLFRQESLLQMHLTKHADKKLYVCDFCSKVFLKRYNLITHLQIHSGEKPYVCEVCSKRFMQKNLLKEHMNTHFDNNPYSCHVCKRKYKSHNSLQCHMKQHFGEKKYICNICKEAFYGKREYNRHMRKHIPRKTYCCDICGKVFEAEYFFKCHYVTHTGEKPFSCNICQKGFGRIQSYKRHMRSHSGEKPYLCYICSKSYSENSKLKMHLRIHSGEKPYACHVCNKAFVSSNKLKIHLRIHSGEKPYSCSVCNKSFNEKGTLQKHMQTHSIQKKYSCEECNKVFSQKHQLQKHSKVHEANV